MWLIPTITDTEIPPIRGPTSLASRFLSPLGDSELDIPLPTTSNPTPKFPKETSKKRTHIHPHLHTHAHTFCVTTGQGTPV